MIEILSYKLLTKKLKANKLGIYILVDSQLLER